MAHRWNLLALILLLAGIAMWYRGSAEGNPVEATATPTPARTEADAPGAASTTPATPPVGLSPPPEEDPPLAMREGEEVNLIIVDVRYDDPYIVVRYANNGAGTTAADFTISLQANGRTFGGNTNYRKQVPEPGVIRKSGGFTPGLVGLQPDGHPAELVVTIDPEDRVREIDESDNTWIGKVDIGRGSVEKGDPPPELAPRSTDGPDLIITNANLYDGNLTITLGNQGDQESTATYTLAVFRDGRQMLTKSDLVVPAPRETFLLMDQPVPDLRPSDLIEVKIDTTNAVKEGREGNNIFIRQLDNSHDL